MNKPLRLRANDPKDLEVVSACLQDALVARRDMSFLDAERRFVMLVNRFRWETAPEEARTAPAEADGEVEPAEGDARFEDVDRVLLERVHALVSFDRVEKVETRNLPSLGSDAILNLLAIRQDGSRILLAFSDDVTIRLSGRHLACYLSDVGDPWPTGWRPSHEIPE